GNWAGFWDAFKHLILPGVITALAGVSELARMTRSAMVENLNKPFAYAERAYGIPENKILFKYILKPSANSIITIAAITMAGFFGGAYISEQIFNFPGLGRYALTAMLQKDVFAVSAVVMYTGVIVMVFNLLIDILISIVDPRVKHNS
ncbi:MAG: ABC transporter permease, partial [Clostridia bacterium]|nr:ABC transporter permease [Clostridia bacterium]